MKFVACTIHGHHDVESEEATSCPNVVPDKTYHARYDADTEALHQAKGLSPDLVIALQKRRATS